MGTSDSFHEGLKAYREARYTEAIELLRAAVTENEEDHKAWNALGVTYSKIGDTKKAIESYNTALKYDPGNESYIRNRDQIPQNASKQVNRCNMNDILVIARKYQKFLIPSVIILLVAAAVITYVLFLGVPNIPTGAQPVVSSPSDVSPEVPVPEVTESMNQTPGQITGEQNVTEPVEKPVTPAVPSAPSSAFVLDGELNGKYITKLQELTFNIRVPEGGTPQFMPRVVYLWSIKSYTPVSVIPITVSSGTINPGEKKQVTIGIPPGMEPKSGESFKLEIKPPSGEPLVTQGTLPEGYMGGIIPTDSESKTQARSGDTGGSSASNMNISGSMQGYYSNELEDLTFSLAIPADGSPQDLTRLTYLWSVDDATPEPLPVQAINPTSGSIAQGDSQLITLKIPPGIRVHAGEKFTLLIKSDTGSSTMVQKILPYGYRGGIIL